MAPDPEAPSPVEQIRQKTRDSHERVETAMGAAFFPDSGFDRSAFRRLLRAFYGLYRPFDRRLAEATKRHVGNFSYEPRSPRLARDLETLGLSPDDLRELPQLPDSDLVALESPPETLGALYVVEGSELGNQLTRRQLEEELESGLEGADAFFHDDSERTSQRWKAFRTRFDERIRDDDALATAVATARACFEMYEGWFS